jgi:hypothetical protein
MDFIYMVVDFFLPQEIDSDKFHSLKIASAKNLKGQNLFPQRFYFLDIKRN